MNEKIMTEYQELISQFLKKGYKSAFFSSSPAKKGALILRHDIDFDIGYAYKLSLLEDQLGVKATYFFLMHSKSYNILERTHLDQIRSIMSRGHHVSIHFDPTLYQDIEEGLQKEKEIFEKVFGVKVRCISIHRPSDYFLNNANEICGVRHTYQPTYFKQIKYFADSQGHFRYGSPFDSEEFKNKDTIQLLIHPIWWVTKGSGPLSKLQEFLDYRIDGFKEHMALNCKPYKKYLEKKK